jgi:hypothetical protein
MDWPHTHYCSHSFACTVLTHCCSHSLPVPQQPILLPRDTGQHHPVIQKASNRSADALVVVVVAAAAAASVAAVAAAVVAVVVVVCPCHFLPLAFQLVSTCSDLPPALCSLLASKHTAQTLATLHNLTRIDPAHPFTLKSRSVKGGEFPMLQDK